MFLLADELAVFEQAMNMQLRLREANARTRGSAAAAILTTWPRVYSALEDTCLLITRGSYASCVPLLRTALDLVAAQRSMVQDGFAEYDEWLAGALSRSKVHAATSIDLGRYKAAGQLVPDDLLGPIYQALMTLSMPHFGASLLLSAPEASPQKISPAFADGAFHLGWAELTTGWTLLVTYAQFQAVVTCGTLQLEKTTPDDLAGFERQITRIVGNRRRCRTELTPDGLLVHNFRRSPAGQPKRLLLS
jgi:hypothetical protein